MGSVRYGARPPGHSHQPRSRGHPDTDLVEAVTVIFETDPEAIASVLPPPLEPSVATARLRIAVVDMGTGLPTFGAGWFGVRARHGDAEGEYALFMPMTTEQATVGGRETFGEPKKIGQITLEVDGDTLTPASPEWDRRWPRSRAPRPRGTRLRDRQARLLLQAPARPVGRRLRGRPRPRLLPPPRGGPGGPARQGECKLLDAPLDPIADFPVSEVCPSTTPSSPRRRRARWWSGCRPSGSLPYMHQRYDDLSVLGAKR